MTDESLSLADKLQRALTIRYVVLDVENGHIQRIKDEHHHEISVSAGSTIGPLVEGAVVNRATTYCRRTLQQDSPLALTNASNQGWNDDLAYQEHELECYLGTTIFVDGDPYGTVCFISREPRPEAFSPTERMFIELLARLIGREIESNRLNNQLTSQHRAREQSEAKNEAVMQAAPAALFLADTETGETVEVNDRATPLEHGDGIGLWLVNWLTTGMGGSVTADVDSEGTAIRLLFPANTDRSETSESHRTHAAVICLQD